ncbi:MAG: alpha-1,4-glucan--maltose-1-phosphate maltosyltransferase [Actinomycetes bacterium]
MIGRIPITDVEPLVSCGEYPAKAVAGESFTVAARVFREGHDAVAANVVLTDPRGVDGPYTPMHPVGVGIDRWEATVRPTGEGDWTYRIEAWSDPIGTWHHDAGIKIPAGQDVDLVCEEGALLYARAAKQFKGKQRKVLESLAATLRDDNFTPEERLQASYADDVVALLDANPLRDLVTTSPSYRLQVDRERALVGAWYELFPRSEGASLDPPRSGTFTTAAERLPAIAKMGFDVVYLPPVHPIGKAFRKGRNNALEPSVDDPGSPWAIGSEDGGHDAIHPDLGTLEDFDEFVRRTRELGMEVALDLALQCSPDHPWAKEHPEWFTVRADGTIAYAENPPKKYQDIYPLNFDKDPEGIYAEVLRVTRHWMDHGVRIFRVDNPHTKPLNFWERLIGEVRATDPDVLFLAEAFTRPAMMHTLAKIGFHQSYTYFTWRNEKWELEEYFRELAGPAAAYMRPNLFVNTPDILHAYLQYGGPPAFKIRAVLASMLAPTYGVYSGYELYEHVAVRPGSEEYLDSEKYQYRPRDWAAAEKNGESLAPYLTRLNEIRNAHAALQRLRNLWIHQTDNDAIMCFSKREVDPATGADDTIIVVVNLDPHAVREGTVDLAMPALGLEWTDGFAAVDELTGAAFEWSQFNYVRLDPFNEPAHILTVTR